MPVWKRSRSWIVAALAAALLAGCHGSQAGWHATDVTGSYPKLDFALERAPDGKPVTAADFRGKVVMLYFGFTRCTSVCPVTLANVSRVLERLGPAAQKVRVLFVTVDPTRDTPQVLADYVKHFGAQVVGLRGTPDQLTALARRYRVAFSVTPQAPGQPYLVTHSSAIYVFDGSGASRLLVSSLGSAQPDVAGTAADLKRLTMGAPTRGFFARLLDRV